MNTKNSSAPPHFYRLPVYLVDDDPSILRLVKIIFEAEGIGQFKCFGGAKEFLFFLDESYDLEKNAAFLLLSDINMPGIDGFELCREVKRRAPFSRVILISGCPNWSDDNQADDFLFKPFSRSELISITKMNIEKMPSSFSEYLN
jgi:DNA-binding response OmpR family regulator